MDVYHGPRSKTRIAGWRDDNSAATKAWVEAQNRLRLIISPRFPSAAIKARLTELWNFERYGVPFKEPGATSITRTTASRIKSVLYVAVHARIRAHRPARPEPTLDRRHGGVERHRDQQGWQSHGVWVVGGGIGLAEWRVRDVRTATDLPDVIKWVKFSNASWTKDGSGFITRVDEPTEAAKLTKVNYFTSSTSIARHAAESEDKLVYHRPDQRNGVSAAG